MTGVQTCALPIYTLGRECAGFPAVAILGTGLDVVVNTEILFEVADVAVPGQVAVLAFNDLGDIDGLILMNFDFEAP